MSHLGDRIAALVDGQLGHEARDRTLAHLALCLQCRTAADTERRTRGMLAGMDGPEPSDDLIRRLLALAEPGPPAPPASRSFPRSFPGPERPVKVAAPAQRRPQGASVASRRPGDRRPRRLRFVAVGALSGFAVVMGTAFVASGVPEQPEAPLSPQVDRFSVEQAGTSTGVPFLDPAYAGYGSTLLGPVQPAFGTQAPVLPPALSTPPAMAGMYGPLGR
jgi:hypothetical protein